MNEVQDRDKIVDLLKDMTCALYGEPTPENLERLVKASEEVLTKLKELQRWANLTEGVEIPF